MESDCCVSDCCKGESDCCFFRLSSFCDLVFPINHFLKRNLTVTGVSLV